jgi:hypothetical protein
MRRLRSRSKRLLASTPNRPKPQLPKIAAPRNIGTDSPWQVSSPGAESSSPEQAAPKRPPARGGFGRPRTLRKPDETRLVLLRVKPLPSDAARPSHTVAGGYRRGEPRGRGLLRARPLRYARGRRAQPLCAGEAQRRETLTRPQPVAARRTATRPPRRNNDEKSRTDRYSKSTKRSRPLQPRPLRKRGGRRSPAPPVILLPGFVKGGHDRG